MHVSMKFPYIPDGFTTSFSLNNLLMILNLKLFEKTLMNI